MSDVPSAERCLEVIDDLRNGWRAERPPADIGPGSPLAFAPLLFGTVSHVITLADGMAVLWRATNGSASRQLAAAPLFRQIIEFGVRAMWLERFRENTEAMVRVGARHRKLLVEEAAKHSLFTDSDGDDRVREAHEFVNQLADDGVTPTFEQMCDHLEGTSHFYFYYRFASNITHPSILLADAYLEATGDSDASVKFVTVPGVPGSEGWLGIATSFLILSALAWDRVDRVRYQGNVLRAYANEFGIPTARPEMSNKGFLAFQEADRKRSELARIKRKPTSAAVARR